MRNSVFPKEQNYPKHMKINISSPTRPIHTNRVSFEPPRSRLYSLCILIRTCLAVECWRRAVLNRRQQRRSRAEPRRTKPCSAVAPQLHTCALPWLSMQTGG
jgi:hypothetical protein